MTHLKKSLGVAALVALLSFTGQTASAMPIDIDILTGSDGNFSYSWIHLADQGKMVIGGNEYWGGASDKWALALDPTMDTLSANEAPAGDFNGITGDLSVNHPDDVLRLSGALDFNVGAGALIGTLDYEWGTAAELLAGTADSGTFWFYNYSFASTPNSFVGGDIRLWGNNWDNKSLTRDEFVTAGGTALGLDLGGEVPPGRPVPEANTTALLIAVACGSLRLFKSKFATSSK